MNTVAGVVLLIGIASCGVLAWMARTALERSVDIGSVAVLAVLAVFGSFCLYIAVRVFRMRSDAPAEAPLARSPGPRRITLSHACSTTGVLLLMASVLLPAHWHAVVFLFAGLGLLCVAHVLTPCEERLEKLSKARASLRQL